MNKNMKKFKNNERIIDDDEKKEVVQELVDIFSDYLIKDASLSLQLLMHKTNFYEKRREDLLNDKLRWFQFIKKNKIKKDLEKLERGILDSYAKIEEELTILNKFKNPINRKMISYKDLLTMIEEERKPKKVKLNLCNDSAIYEYSSTNYSYVLKDKDKNKDIFNTYLNETLTDLQMIENIIEII